MTASYLQSRFRFRRPGPGSGSYLQSRGAFQQPEPGFRDDRIAAAPGPVAIIDLGENANLNGYLPFPADNPWNQDISALPVDPNSDAIVTRADRSTHPHCDFGSGLSEGAKIGVPYIVVPADQPLATINFGAYASQSDQQPYPFPPNAPIEGWNTTAGYTDGHVVVIQRDETKPNGMGKLYEAFRATPNGSYPTTVTSWDVYQGSIFDLNSNALRTHGWTSADAAGLPIFPGLIRYEEILAGEIKHAIRFTLAPGYTRRAWVHPATHHAGFGDTSEYAPFGARFRLKADFDLTGFPPVIQIIGRAMQKYGLILADNGGDWFISGVPDPRWDNAILAYLGYIWADFFEVVQMGTVYTS